MNYVIIGGDAAGMSAAMQIVRNEKNASITVLEKEDIYSYAQCGLPYVVGGIINSTDPLIARSVQTFREKYGIDARINHEVKGIDVENKRVYGDDFEVAYDKLLIATGASPIVPPWEGKDLEGIHVIKTIHHTNALIEELAREYVKDVVVIGGGYIGLEMSENIVAIGKNVTLIQRSDQLATMFDKEMAAIIHAEAQKHGIVVRLEEEVKQFIGEKRVAYVKTNKGEIRADLVIVAVGVKPNTQFLDGTGIALHPSGAIKVNRFMETNLPDIYAAGDCATQYHRIKKEDDYIPLGTHANKQGRLAGLAMIGRKRPFAGVVGTSILKFFDLTLGRTGLSAQQLRSMNVPFKEVTIEARHIAGYYPNSEKITIKLCYDPDTERLLGGQVIGKAGVDKRIDVLATALYHSMTVGELEDLDLAYAPPYNTVWDPLQQAARRRKVQK